MKCPRCAQEQPDAPECRYCGIIVAKYQARQTRSTREPLTVQPALETRTPGPGPAARSVTAARHVLRRARRDRWAERLLRLLLPPTAARRNFFLSLGRMVRSGVGVEKALQTLEVTGRGVLRQLAQSGRTGVSQGRTLTESLDDALVPALHAGLLEAGEQTGNLEVACRQLADLDNESLTQARRLLSNLTYPAIVFLASCFLMPLPTLILGGSGAYATAVAGRLLLLVLGALGGWIGWRLLTQVSSQLLARLPGAVERTVMPARRAFFFLVLRTALQAGLPIRQGLLLAGRCWHSTDNREAVERAVAAIDAGASLTEALTPLVDAGHVVLLATGEESGQLEESFAELHEAYSIRAAARRKVLFMLAGVLLTIALLATVATQVLDSYQQSIEAPMQEFEQMMNQEMRGILTDI